MRAPYPVTVAPLLQQFLLRRRAKSDYPLRAMERLGLDRPAFYAMIDLGIQDPRGARPEDIGNAYRTTDSPIRASMAAAESVGLVAWRDERWSLTDKGRAALGEFRRALDAYFAGLAPIDAAELDLLARSLEAALAASVAAPEPMTREHTPRAARYRWQEPASAFARLDAAIYGLWQFRDDCHVQAWRDAGLAGPVLDVLTRVWHREAETADELAPKMAAQRTEDVRTALDQLRAGGLVATGPRLALTAKGTTTRERIEAETDRYFFAPWPDDVGARADWLIDRLSAVNTALA